MKDADNWKKRLSSDQFRVLHEKATEAPFSGKYVSTTIAGNYVCAACGATLFSSEKKFNSGSGWPSFSDVIDSGAVQLVEDKSHGMVRTEVQCAHCEGHLGHLFEDAYDQPTGLRYCINSLALELKPKGDV